MSNVTDQSYLHLIEAIANAENALNANLRRWSLKERRYIEQGIANLRAAVGSIETISAGTVKPADKWETLNDVREELS